jgi:hypothetical protein
MQDAWRHETECAQIQQFDRQRKFYISESLVFTNGLETQSEEQIEENYHRLHKWMEDVLNEIKKRGSASRIHGNHQ